MKTVRFPDGTAVPAIGQGTWRLGEEPQRAQDETAAIRAGVDAGLSVIDTAEMYGEGATERFLGTALAGLREQVFLVSKAYPQNASRSRLPVACENSLKRLRTDRLDLYLLHWRGSVPLGETVEAMERLVDAGKIMRWGVSNFDTNDMVELLEAGGTNCATNQILYNLGRRGCEYDLLPHMARNAVPATAYSPMEQGRLNTDATLKGLAASRGVAPLQIALAWVLDRDEMLVIPKAGTTAHVQENLAAASIAFTEQERQTLDQAFPSPRRRTPLEML